MPIIINGQTLENGAPLLVDGVQAQNVMCNGVEVWINNYVADAPTGFLASDGETDQITFTWTLPVDQGVPTCSYEVRNVALEVIATAGVGVTTAIATAMGSASDTYSVYSINSVGESIASNSDAGSSVAPYSGPPSPVTITVSGDYVAGTDFPAGVELTICMAGAGGSGSSNGNDYTIGGGYAGEIVSSAITFGSDEIVTATIGVGGVPPNYTNAHGNPGTPTVFGALTATGGGGGNTGGYFGNGGEVTTCGGTGVDGTMQEWSGYYRYGGQSSGFSNGGNGRTDVPGYAGGVGSGGGAGHNSSRLSGAGGAGIISVTW